MRDFVAALRHPFTLAAGPLQATETQELCEALTLRDFVAARRHPSPPAAGDAKKKGIRAQASLALIPFFFAESEGFEPPNPLGSTVFKTAAINHSANSPIFSSGIRSPEKP